MTIRLPNDLEGDVRAEVLSGHFASVEEMVAAAVREYLRTKRQGHPPATTATSEAHPGLGSIGFMRDAAAELDEVVADAYRKRREDKWRDIDLE